MTGLRAVRRRHVWLVAPFVALVAPLSRTIDDNSFLWHVRAGTIQLDIGEVLRTDPFTFTAAGEPWRTQSWLAELGYGWLENTFGGVGWSVAIVLVSLLSAGLLTLVRGARLGAGTASLVGLGLLFVFQTFSFAVPRPVVLTHVLLAAVALLADDDESEIWVAPALMWLWASLHGSFAIGLGVLTLDALRRRSARRGAVAALSALTASLGAHGFAVWAILLDFAGSRATLGFIEEWGRPDLTDIRVAPFFVVLVLLVALTVARRIQIRDLVLVIPFAVFGLTAVRNVLPALVVIGPVVAAGIHRSLRVAADRPPDARESPVANALLVAAVVGLLVLATARPHLLDADRFPPPSVVTMLDGERVVHDDAVGGYLIWALGPDQPVFIDDRAELHGVDAFMTMRDVLAGDVARVEAMGAVRALLGEQQPLVPALLAAGWTERASGGGFVLLAADDRP